MDIVVYNHPNVLDHEPFKAINFTTCIVTHIFLKKRISYKFVLLTSPFSKETTPINHYNIHLYDQ